MTWSFPLLFADILCISFTLPPHLAGSDADACLFMPLRPCLLNLEARNEPSPPKLPMNLSCPIWKGKAGSQKLQDSHHGRNQRQQTQSRLPEAPILKASTLSPRKSTIQTAEEEVLNTSAPHSGSLWVTPQENLTEDKEVSQRQRERRKKKGDSLKLYPLTFLRQVDF